MTVVERGAGMASSGDVATAEKMGDAAQIATTPAKSNSEIQKENENLENKKVMLRRVAIEGDLEKIDGLIKDLSASTQAQGHLRRFLLEMPRTDPDAVLGWHVVLPDLNDDKRRRELAAFIRNSHANGQQIPAK